MAARIISKNEMLTGQDEAEEAVSKKRQGARGMDGPSWMNNMDERATNVEALLVRTHWR